MKKRTAALLLTFVLIFGAAVGGTVAWLTAKTGDVVNTFTVGDINIDLREHKLMTDEETGKYYLDENSEVQTNSYNFVPGDTLPKDPFVRVQAGSEACYLFIRVKEANNTVDEVKIVNYTVDESVWNAVPGQKGYWYCIITADEAKDGITKSILTNQNPKVDTDNVMVSDRVTKEMADKMTAAPTITFTAAAIQYENIADVTTAFAQLPPDFKPAQTN